MSTTMTVNTTTADDVSQAHLAVARAKDLIAGLEQEYSDVKTFRAPGYSARWRVDFKERFAEASNALADRENEVREVEGAFAEAERQRLIAMRPRVLREHRDAVRAVVAALPAFRSANMKLRRIVAEHGGATLLEVGPLAVADGALEEWLRDAETLVKRRGPNP